MELANKIQAIAEAIGAEMRTAFGWDSTVPIYLNGSVTPITAKTFGEIEVSVPTIEMETPVSDEATLAFDLSARWPQSAVPSGTLRGIFQAQHASNLRARLTEQPNIGDGYLPHVDSILLDDMEVEQESGVAITLTFTCRVSIARGA